jgi:hypothetical protein
VNHLPFNGEAGIVGFIAGIIEPRRSRRSYVQNLARLNARATMQGASLA